MFTVPVSLTLNITSQYDDVGRFMQASEHEVNTPAAIILQLDLISEEVLDELVPALYYLLAARKAGVDCRDELVAVADGIVDSVYVLLGLANALQLPFDELFAAVHANNMSKIQRDAEGKLLKREDGKLLKPAGYVPVDLESIIFPPQQSSPPPL